MSPRTAGTKKGDSRGLRTHLGFAGHPLSLPGRRRGGRRYRQRLGASARRRRRIRWRPFQPGALWRSHRSAAGDHRHCADRAGTGAAGQGVESLQGRQPVADEYRLLAAVCLHMDQRLLCPGVSADAAAEFGATRPEACDLQAGPGLDLRAAGHRRCRLYRRHAGRDAVAAVLELADSGLAVPDFGAVDRDRRAHSGAGAVLQERHRSGGGTAIPPKRLSADGNRRDAHRL